MPSYKLTYFNATGRAEVARMLFAVAGEKYEDKRIQHADWSALKQGRNIEYTLITYSIVYISIV